MNRRKTPEEKIEELEKQRGVIQARLQRERAKVTSRKRKEDTRRKIIAGAIALEHAEQNAAFGKELLRVMDQHVTRAQDRALLDLPPLPEPVKDEPAHSDH